jgi:hypothetical protein
MPFARHPRELEVRHVPGDEDEVERPVADDLVGDVDVAAARVAGLGKHSGSFACSQRRGRGRVTATRISERELALAISRILVARLASFVESVGARPG